MSYEHNVSGRLYTSGDVNPEVRRLRIMTHPDEVSRRVFGNITHRIIVIIESAIQMAIGRGLSELAKKFTKILKKIRKQPFAFVPPDIVVMTISRKTKNATYPA